jgi:signal transduction histidine kinase/FixJ family two-component response regulator
MKNTQALGLNGSPFDAPEPDGDSENTNGQVPAGSAEAVRAELMAQEKVKILIVDDLPHKLTALESILEGDDVIIEKASSGFEALRRLLREDFAVILLDVLMPGLDGYETAGLIRQRKRSEHIPIIFITANVANDQAASKGYSLGAVDYINAPVIPEILKAKVAVFVELFRINRKVKLQAKAMRSYTLDLELANRKLESRSRELQTSRESFRNIVEKNAEGIAVVDAAGTIRFANAAFGNMLGDPPGGLVGRAFPFELEVGRILEMDQTRPDSSVLPIEISVMETHWEGETAFLASVRDISLRRAAEQSMRDSEEKLRQAQKLESIGRLAGGVAHDFNNLLTAINGYTDMVLAAMEEDNSFRGYLQEVRRSGERAAELTHQLLAYSRKQVLVPKTLNLNSVVENMTNMLRRLIGDHVELASNLDPHIGLVKVDPGQVEQVIMNLVVNAKDAMPSGGRINVETSVEMLDADTEGLRPIDKELSISPGRYVVLTVSDNGTGMDDVTIARIFEPFFTTKDVGRGTGLGLSMVYGFLKQSGGNISVTSAPGDGSVFKVYLPLAAGAGAVWKPTGTEEDSKPSRGFETILLVEDEHTVRKFLLNVLQNIGYKVLEAQDGKQAMDFAAGYAEPVDLLLTDVMMANMGGKELSEKLSLTRPDMKILFMSGYAEEGSPFTWNARESVDFLQKPFSPSVLAQKVRSVLDKAPAGKT